MNEIFIELQIAIQEGTDLDLNNEDCHMLNKYIDDLLEDNKKLRSERLELAKEIVYSGNMVFNYQLSSSTKPNQCVDFVANSMSKVFIRAEKIASEENI